MEIYTLTLGYCQTNVYVLSENGTAAVIDPSDDVQGVLRFLQNRNLRVKYALVTHGHFDHIGGVYALQKNGATVYMSKEDYNLVDFTDTNSLFGAPKEKFTPDVYVRDGDELDILGHSVRVISAPGHTPGGVCYIFDDSKIFTGDTLFRHSVGRTDFPHGDFAELKKSVKKLFALTGDYTVFPGHGESTTLDFERANNLYVH